MPREITKHENLRRDGYCSQCDKLIKRGSIFYSISKHGYSSMYCSEDCFLEDEKERELYRQTYGDPVEVRCIICHHVLRLDEKIYSKGAAIRYGFLCADHRLEAGKLVNKCEKLEKELEQTKTMLQKQETQNYWNEKKLESLN